MFRQEQRTTNGLAGIVVWALVSGVILLVGYGAFGALMQTRFGLLLAFVFPLIIFVVMLLAIVGGPAGVLIAGAKRRNLAMIAGPLLLFALIAIWIIGSDWLEMRRNAEEIARLDTGTFAMPKAGHDLIAMDYRASAVCDNICKQILLQSDFRVAVKEINDHWLVYHKISDSLCQETWDVRRNIRFAGICVTNDVVIEIDNALLVTNSRDFWSSAFFPEVTWEMNGYYGQKYALIERQPGQKDRLLGRWLAGEVRRGFFTSPDIGREFTRAGFYSAALGLKIAEYRR